MAPAPAGGTLIGIAWMIASVAMFALLNALIKVVVQLYPLGEVIFFRNLFALVPLAVVMAMNEGWRHLVTRRPGLMLLRCLLGLANVILMFLSLSLLPLADATALTFSGPLFLTALSVPLLGEKVGIHRWSAVLVGFAGVLIMVQPSPQLLEQPGTLLGVAAAFIYALSLITVRWLSPTESSVTITFWFTVTCMLAAAAALPLPMEPEGGRALPGLPPFWGFVWPAWPHLGLLALTGLFGGLGHYFVALAHRHAEATAVSPFGYLQIVFAALIGLMVFQETPSLGVVAGLPIVVASGLYILWRERQRARPAAPLPLAATAVTYPPPERR